MKASWAGTCNLCYKGWDKDAYVARWTGNLVHRECRDRAADNIRSTGRVTALKGGLRIAEKQAVRKVRRRGVPFS